MKRSWLFLVAAVVAALGCRSSQPATNPFLRTTVPPPATGQGAVVVPGEQYYPAGSAPLTTAPPPIYTAPPPITTTPPPGVITSPAVTTPGAPPPIITPMPPPVAPPAVVPPRDKYSPPGGSFQYNQS